MVEQAEVKYKTALALYHTNKFQQSKKKFIELEAFYPGYKDVLMYLARIDDEIARTVVQPEKKLERIQIDNTQWEPEVFQSKIQVEQVVNDGSNRVKSIYSEARSLYKRKQYEEAFSRFLEVNQLQPGYKSVDAYLKKTERLIAKRQRLKDRQMQKEQARLEKIKKAEEKKVRESKRNAEQAKKQQVKETVQEEEGSSLAQNKDLLEAEKKRKAEEQLAREKIKEAMRLEKIKKKKLAQAQRQERLAQKRKEKEQRRMAALQEKELKKKQKAQNLAKRLEEKEKKRLEKLRKREEKEKKSGSIGFAKKVIGECSVAR